MKLVVYQKWEESERGWGTRPDGCSLHLTSKDKDKFIKEYWERMPKKVLDEYSRPIGNSKFVLINKDLYEKIQKSDYGIWQLQSEERKLINEKGLVLKF